MEKNKERVLAYSLAKVISFEDLAAVSGGGVSCSSQTTGPSGQSRQDLDVRIDVHVDW